MDDVVVYPWGPACNVWTIPAGPRPRSSVLSYHGKEVWLNWGKSSYEQNWLRAHVCSLQACQGLPQCFHLPISTFKKVRGQSGQNPTINITGCSSITTIPPASISTLFIVNAFGICVHMHCNHWQSSREGEGRVGVLWDTEERARKEGRWQVSKMIKFLGKGIFK